MSLLVGTGLPNGPVVGADAHIRPQRKSRAMRGGKKAFVRACANLQFCRQRRYSPPHRFFEPRVGGLTKNRYAPRHGSPPIIDGRLPQRTILLCKMVQIFGSASIKKDHHQTVWSFFIGALEKIRTPDLLIRSQTLYPAELPAHTLGLSQSE